MPIVVKQAKIPQVSAEISYLCAQSAAMQPIASTIAKLFRKLADKARGRHVGFSHGVDELDRIDASKIEQDIPTTHGVGVRAFQQQHLALEHEAFERHLFVLRIGNNSSPRYACGPNGEQRFPIFGVRHE